MPYAKSRRLANALNVSMLFAWTAEDSRTSKRLSSATRWRSAGRALFRSIESPLSILFRTRPRILIRKKATSTFQINSFTKIKQTNNDKWNKDVALNFLCSSSSCGQNGLVHNWHPFIPSNDRTGVLLYGGWWQTRSTLQSNSLSFQFESISSIND